MYAIARLYGYVEEVGFRAWLSSDIAKALGVRVGEGVRLESKLGSSAARVVDVRDDVKAGVYLTLDVYMAVSGFRTVLIKRLPRVFEADAVALGVETQSPVEVDDVLSLVHLMVAYRVPVFSGFTGYLQTERSQWVKVVVKEVSPREPAYLSRETKVLVR